MSTSSAKAKAGYDLISEVMFPEIVLYLPDYDCG